MVILGGSVNSASAKGLYQAYTPEKMIPKTLRVVPAHFGQFSNIDSEQTAPKTDASKPRRQNKFPGVLRRGIATSDEQGFRDLVVVVTEK
jgi:hypothetical protein